MMNPICIAVFTCAVLLGCSSGGGVLKSAEPSEPPPAVRSTTEAPPLSWPELAAPTKPPSIPASLPELRGLSIAGAAYQRESGKPPRSFQELVKFCFLWPNAEGNPNQPLYLDPDTILFNSKEAKLPVRRSDGSTSSVRFSIGWVGPSVGGIQTATPAYFEPLTLQEWDVAKQYFLNSAVPEDLPLISAFDSIVALIEAVVRRTGSLPDHVKVMEATAGARLVNLEKSEESAADIVLGWDGVQAYRLKAVLRSGLTLDSVIYYESLDGRFFERPYLLFEREVGRPMQTIGSWRLALGSFNPLLADASTKGPLPSPQHQNSDI